jgi:zinc finger protein
MTTHYYNRTEEQNTAIGLQPGASEVEYRDDEDSNYKALADGGFGKSKKTKDLEAELQAQGTAKSTHGLGVRDDDAPEANPEEEEPGELGRTEAVSLPSPCPHCNRMGESLTALTDIPHFKEVIIMSFCCKICGFRNNEVKGGGAIPTKGCSVTLTVNDAKDLHRDVLKSDSCMVMIPIVELELQHGSLGGCYTTVEGLIDKIIKSLSDCNPFAVGDSSYNHHSEKVEQNEQKSKFAEFMNQMRDLKDGKVFPFNITMRDPLGNSFFSPRIGEFIPPEVDSCLKMENFKRSFEENEDFGLNDINTRDFETGVEYNDEEEVLPDRLTHVLPKGSDHPHVFAKGMTDEMEGGVYRGVSGVGSSSGASSGASGSGETGAEEQDADVDDEEEEPYDGSRRFDDDSKLKFLQFDEFNGKKSGYVFRCGSQGLGYYEDDYVPPNQSSSSISHAPDMVD